MLKVERILFPTDFSGCADEALPRAVNLAEKFGAELHMLHALVLHAADPGNISHTFPKVEELYQLLERDVDQQLARTAEAHADRELTIHSVQQRGISAAGVVLDYIEDHDIDLVVMGTHGRRGLRRLLLGSVAEEVVRVAPCPVLAVPEQGHGNVGRKIETIVVPIDFSEHSRLALDYARALATEYEARLQLLHVVEEAVYPDFYLPVMASGEVMTEKLLGQARERLDALIDDATDSVPAEPHTREGRAANEIATFAEEQEADLIVIASHGLTGLSHILLGSVTEQVIRRAVCPIFTVKAFGKKLI